MKNGALVVFSLLLLFATAVKGQQASTSASSEASSTWNRGTGSATLSPTALTFANTYVGTDSAARSVTLSNGTAQDLNLHSISASANFMQSNTCGSVLQKGKSCAIRVSFDPTVGGPVTGSLTVMDSAGTQTTNLSGTGVAQTGIAVTPSAVTMNTGDTKKFTAYPSYSDGTTGTTALRATWVSTNVAVVQVDVNGDAVADAGGTGSVTATSGSFSGAANVTVNGTQACSGNNRMDMKLLVITKAQSEADFPAITSALNYLQMPFTVFDTSTGAALTQGMLNSGCHAFYNGVIVAFLDGSAYNPATFTYPFVGYDVLQTFEQTFKVRQLNWYVFPAPSIGFNWGTGSQEGDTGIFQTAAVPVFPYVQLASNITIDVNAFVNLATPSGGTSLISDETGKSLTLDYPLGDGREYLSNTFDSNPYMLQAQVLSYGLINWVTKGLFLGEKHIYFTPQEDDWGIDDDIWTQNDGTYLQVSGATQPGIGSYPACTSPINTVTGMAYRISGADANAFATWQTKLQSNPLFTRVKLYNAFNACGLVRGNSSDPNCGAVGSPYPNDTLTSWTEKASNSINFGWMNHTYEHANLNTTDSGSPQTYQSDFYQINENLLQEPDLGFADFTSTDMVTPDISGLNYLPALQAMVANGVQYVVSDTSCSADKFVGTTPTCDTSSNNGPGPGFNLPIINSNNPVTTPTGKSGNIYEVPRRPSTLFYNVGDPLGWQNEYQCIYKSQSPYATYTEQQIKDFNARSFVGLMLQGDADPEMFHQTNLKAFDGTHSLLSDLIDDTFTLYQQYFTLPVQSMSLPNLATFMLNNSAIQNSGVVGTINNGSTRSVTLVVTNPATIPITGLMSAGAEQYGGQFISHVPMKAGETLTQTDQ